MQRRNLPLFGYGAKAFMLSVIEAAIALSAGAVTTAELQRVLALGKHLPGVAAGLAELQRRGHPLMVLTKGDLFDQESKLARSGLGDYFAHVEVVSEQDAPTYRRLLARHGVAPAAFVLVGNSLKSDILPVAQLGGRAIHVPYHPTWMHEEVPAAALVGVTFEHASSLAEVLALLS